MKKEDWLRIVKWMGYVYTPIILLIIAVFLLAEYRANIAEKDVPTASSSAPDPQ